MLRFTVNLVIDTYNVYKRVSYYEGRIVYKFFEYIHLLQKKLKSNKVYFAIDGAFYLKKSIDLSYKSNRKKADKSIYDRIVRGIPLIKNFNLLVNDTLEADDLSFCFCRDNDHTICVSEDYDWLYNLIANSDIRIYRKKKLIHLYNFENELKYPLQKIKLDMFLRGDSKDGVKKPFRLKGSLMENINKYESVDDYLEKNKIDKVKIDKYMSLIYPITSEKYDIIKGKTTSDTKKFVNTYRINFVLGGAS